MSEKKDKKGLVAGIIAGVVLIIFFLIILLTATPKIVGKYSLSAFIIDGKETTEMLDFIKSVGGDWLIEFKKDRTGTLEMRAGESVQITNFTYTDKELKLEDNSEVVESENVWSYESKDDDIIVNMRNETVKFTRIKE